MTDQTQFPEAGDKKVTIYMAGFFDGEGSIGIGKAKSRVGGLNGYRYRVTVSIVNTNLKVIELFKKHFAIEYMNTKTRFRELTKDGTRRKKTAYAIQVFHGHAKRILEEMLPYLIIKKKQAEIAIAFQEHINQEKIKRDPRNKRFFKVTEESIKVRLGYYDQIKLLNMKGQPI